MPAAETNNLQLLVVDYNTDSFSSWDMVWLDVFNGLSWKGDSGFFPPGVFPRILCIQLVDEQRDYGAGHKGYFMAMPGAGTCHFLPHSIGQTLLHDHNLTQGKLGDTDHVCAQEVEMEKVNM